jgi:hypothetical protein
MMKFEIHWPGGCIFGETEFWHPSWAIIRDFVPDFVDKSKCVVTKDFVGREKQIINSHKYMTFG